MAEASDFKFGTQLAFAKVRRKSTPRLTSSSAKLGTFLINVQLFAVMHKIALMGHPMGIRGNISTLSENFDAEKLR